MNKDDNWKEGQRGLAEEVTGEGLVDWVKVTGVWHVCKKKGVCEDAIKRLIK